MGRVRLPRIAARLLTLVCRDEPGRDVAADLAEEFHEVAGRHGIRAARRWYRRQVARSIADRVAGAAGRSVAASAAAAGGLWSLTRVGTDLVPALRALRRAPWYATTVIAVVALALALATTVFAVVDGVLFKPLPYANPDRVVQVSPLNPMLLGSSFRSAGNTSHPDLRAWRAAAPDLDFTATTFGGSWPISDNESVRAAQVDRRFFDVLGVRPALGGFRDDEFGPLTPIRPALVTHRFWHDRLGGDPAAIGRVLSDGAGEGIRVAGVLGPDFLFPHFGASRFPVDALLPLYDRPAARDDPRRRNLHVVARVPDGVSLDAAAARLTAAQASVAALFPPMSEEELAGARAPFTVVRLEPIGETFTRDTRTVAGASVAAAAFLVLLACLNLAGLAGSRVLDRRRELSMRRALGAGASALIRVVAIEQVLLVAAGAVAGLAMSWWSLRAAPWLLPADVTVLKAPVVDIRVVAFAATACALVVAIVTAWSARAAFRAGLRPSLAGSGGSTERGRSAARLVIVGGQVALALAIVVTGTLFATSLVRVWQEDPGFRVDRSAIIHVDPPRGADAAFFDRMLGVVRRVPGVTAAGGLGGPFLQRAIMGSGFDRPDGAAETGDVEHLRITIGLLDAAGLEPIEGRVFTDEELAVGRPVLVVSETVARAYFPGGTAVGRTLSHDGRAFEIVGVVPDARYRSLDAESDGEIYSPLAHWDNGVVLNVLVSYEGDAGAALGDTVAALMSQVPALRLRTAMTVRQKLGTTVQSRQFQTAVFVGFGAAALAIASAGILGLMAMTVARRTREIGIRMALGGTPAGVVRLMLREHLPAVAAGLALGTLGAAWGVRVIASYLYEMGAYDWRAWTAAVLVLLLVTTTAALLPALRASRVDPVRALRVD